MKTVLGLAILAVSLSGAFGIECYQCTDCSLSGVFSLLEDKVQCDSGLSFGGLFSPSCTKVVASDGSVTRGCTVTAGCAFGAFVAECSSGSSTNCISCCDTDLCNSALNLKAAWLALGLALLTALLVPRM